MQTAPEWGQGAFEISHRPRPAPRPCEQSAQSSGDSFSSQPCTAPRRNEQQDDPFTATPPNTSLGLQRDPPGSRSRWPQEEPLRLFPTLEKESRSGKCFPSLRGQLLAGERLSDAHSPSLCEELRTLGGDRYSAERRARDAPHLLTHTPAARRLNPGDLWTESRGVKKAEA